MTVGDEIHFLGIFSEAVAGKSSGSVRIIKEDEEISEC